MCEFGKHFKNSLGLGENGVVLITQQKGQQGKTCQIDCTRIWKTFSKLAEFGKRRFSRATNTSPE